MEYQELEENNEESTLALPEHIKKRRRITGCVILGVGCVLMMFGALAEGRIEDETTVVTCFGVGLVLNMIAGFMLIDRPQRSTSTELFKQQKNPVHTGDRGRHHSV